MARFSYAGQFFDSAGDPLNGGKLYFYESGTTTPKTTYSDTGETTPNANPVVLDADGRMGDVFYTGDAKLVVKTSADVTLQTIDPVGGDTLSGAEIAILYEAVSDRNQYSDAEKTKLAGIETAADVTDEANVTSAISGATISTVTPATGDKLLLQDVSDSDNLKAATASSVLDLVSYDFSYGSLANGEYIGITFDSTASSSVIPAYGGVRLAASADKVSGTANTNSDTASGVGIITSSTGPSINDPVTVLSYGIIRNTSWSWTPGDQLYGGTNGALTATKYSTTGQYNCRLAIAINADTILVNPQEPVVVP